MIDAKGDVVLDAGMHEAAIPNIDTDSVPGYLAYSPTGTVEVSLELFFAARPANVARI